MLLERPTEHVHLERVERGKRVNEDFLVGTEALLMSLTRALRKMSSPLSPF